MRYPKHLLRVIEVLKKLPGVGNKSAERFAFQLLNWTPTQLLEFGQIMQEIPAQLRPCKECGCLQEAQSECLFCTPERGRNGVMCVIATARDVFSMEDTREYHGLYHVLGGTLSPIDGKRPEALQIHRLKERIQRMGIKEVVIALDSTLEGDTTSLFLKQELEPMGVSISRLAFGIPIGSSLDYIDGGTLARAFSGRSRF